MDTHLRVVLEHGVQSRVSGHAPEGGEVGDHRVEGSDEGVGRSQRGQRQRLRQGRRKPPYSQESRRVALRLEPTERTARLLLLLLLLL